MPQNTKVSALFFAALLFVGVARPTWRDHLEDIVKHLNQTKLAKEFSHRQTPHVIDTHKCEPEDFCRAEKVLSKIDHKDFGKNGAIVRALGAYNKHFKASCTVDESGDQLELREFLNQLRICVQSTYARRHL